MFRMSRPTHDDMLTEAEAAALMGWTPANLRSHRLRWAAHEIAESLSADQRLAVLAVRQDHHRGVAGATPHEPLVLRGLALVRPVDVPGDGPGEWVRAWELSALGLEVSRRLRQGPRVQEPPQPAETREGLRYRRGDLLAWLDRRPDVRDAQALLDDTISTAAASKLLGLAVTTLRSTRSRAQRARARIAAGKPQPGDDVLAQAVPVSIRVGAHQRYRRADVKAWLAQYGGARGHDPLEEPLPKPRGRLLTEAQAARAMGIAPTCLPGYRTRARKALRWLALLPMNPDAPASVRQRYEQQSRAAPPHVRLPNGARRYRAETVAAWVKARPRKA
jgi:hypothetical protein